MKKRTNKSTATAAQYIRLLAMLRWGGEKSTLDFRKNGVIAPAARIKELNDKYGYSIPRVASRDLYDEQGFCHPRIAIYRLESEPEGSEYAAN